MSRPDFTPEEENLIALVRANERPPLQTFLQWLPGLVLSLGLYVYGIIRGVTECEVTGFIIAFGLLCRFVYYQVKPGWRLKPIIDKYEAACETS